jgi:hypothetical protein
LSRFPRMTDKKAYISDAPGTHERIFHVIRTGNSPPYSLQSTIGTRAIDLTVRLG